MWLCACLWLISLTYMPCSDTQAMTYGTKQKQERGSDLLFALENKEANRSKQMALCVMSMGGNSSTLPPSWSSPLDQGKFDYRPWPATQKTNKAFICLSVCRAFHPALILSPDFKTQNRACFWHVGVLKARCFLEASMKKKPVDNGCDNVCVKHSFSSLHPPSSLSVPESVFFH